MARAPAPTSVPHAPRYAVVIAGGSGTRFWPRSRARAPKQLLAILGGRSLLQDTVARISPPLRRDRVLVVTGRAHARAVRRQLPRLAAGSVLVEPEARNTAAAIALAALHIARRAPDAVMAVLPADHAISRLGLFRRDLALCSVRLLTVRTFQGGNDDGPFGWLCRALIQRAMAALQA